METIYKCISIALSELGKLSFSGQSVIPAGNAMEALYLAAAETERLIAEQEEKEKQTNNGEEAEKQTENSEKAVEADAN